MRSFLFKGVTTVTASLIIIIQTTSAALSGLTGRVGYALMAVIDGERLKMYEKLAQPAELSDLGLQQTELQLLSGASQVRDHAKENGEWTERHTEAIQAIGDALVESMDWEEDAVHQYLREVVESIDGLGYDLE